MYKDRICHAENSFAHAPEMTMDSGEKTEEAIANLCVCAKYSVTGRAPQRTFAYDIFSLPHKNWRASFPANTFVT